MRFFGCHRALAAHVCTQSIDVDENGVVSAKCKIHLLDRKLPCHRIMLHIVDTRHTLMP